MSLLRLLAVGRSFGGAKDEVGRYRMTPETLLPNFGSELEAKVATPGVGQSGALTPPKARSFWQRFRARWFKSGISMRPPATAQNASCDPSVKAMGISQERLAIWSRKRGGDSMPAAPVQCELALQQVRVMRNDLSEADLEVVSVRERAPKKATRSPESVPADSRKTGVIWNQLSARLFVAGRSRSDLLE